MDQTLLERDTFASFTYQEADVPPETTFYTRYIATVEVSYELNSSSRRMLLQVSDNNDETNELIAIADAVFMDKIDNNDKDLITEDDGVVIIKMDKCLTSEELEAYRLHIAKFLRLHESLIAVDYEVEASDCSYTLVRIIIRNNECTDSIIDQLLDELKEGIYDPFSTFYQNTDNLNIYQDYVDHDFYYVVQVPADNHKQAVISSHNNVDNTTLSSYSIWIYFAAGAFIGITLTTLVLVRKRTQKIQVDN